MVSSPCDRLLPPPAERAGFPSNSCARFGQPGRLSPPTGPDKYEKVDTKTAPVCKSKLCKNRKNATHSLSRGGGAVEQLGGQTIDGGLVDGHEAERLVKGKGRLVGRQGLHLDEGPGVLSCPPDHLGDQIPAIAFAAMGRGHLDTAQTGSGPSVAATEPGHVPGGGPRQLGSVGSGQQTKPGEMKLTQGLVLPPVDRESVLLDDELGLAASQDGSRIARFGAGEIELERHGSVDRLVTHRRQGLGKTRVA